MKALPDSIRSSLVLCTLLLCFISGARAQAVPPNTVTFSNHQVQASFTLPSSLDLAVSLEFEQAIGLHAANLMLTAEVLSPTDPRIVDRLPAAVTAVSSFPVLVSVVPDPLQGFAFAGAASIEFYTQALHYDSNIPWRLFTSHDGDTFEDITTLTTAGSYRARGSTGRFSDFLILLDSRAPHTIISHKVQRLSETIYDNQELLPAPLALTLDTLLRTLQTALLLLNNQAALLATDELISLLENTSGSVIPDVWRADGAITNVRGELLARLYTLRYSLRTL
ncbi:DUF6689 family protein [Salinimonas sediminis]|uniref:Uncharacterized protein n=1 Tax=Salinimonas sediminis TaxID=2303538 RepID=A0A346NQL3_9ALTE|nr:DUF6689 family protein [Salinimonas sediminis]AXR07820.1 hypothetical protein D0Y50_16490 [Salinimonas sediminis]